jgi:putative phosphoesterase
MKIAVISDIHSNILALEAVLKDIERQQVDQVYCAGDLVGYAPFPNEVIELIRQKQIPTVMGNYDDGIGFMRFICGCDYKDEKAQALGEKSIVWTKAHTTEENKDFLRNLPSEIRFTVDGKKVLLVHGSPNRLNEYITENIPRDYALDLIELNDADILICGHTHIPFKMVLKDKLLINVGSVGKPKHGEPSARYSTVDFGADIEVEFHKVPYDYEAVAKAIEESDLPNEFAALIRSGKG